MTLSTNDAAPSSTETLHLAYAEASVVLIEALMQLLVDRKVIPMDELIETLEMTIQTKRVLEQEGDHARISSVAAGVLSSITNSIAAGSTRNGGSR